MARPSRRTGAHPPMTTSDSSPEQVHITTIIRVHCADCFLLLDQCLFSLYNQLDVNILVVVATQNLTSEETNTLISICRSYIGSAISDIKFAFSKNTLRGDARAALLNAGIQLAQGSYLAFLDYDDLLYPTAYKTLIAELARSGAQIAFGEILSVYYENIGGAPYISRKAREYRGSNRYELFVENFCPIHSYVLDRTAITKEDLHFDERLWMLEDYEFLLRIAAKYQSSFSQIDTTIGEYFKRKEDTIHDARTRLISNYHSITILSEAREKIARLKQHTTTIVPLSEFEMIGGLSRSLAHDVVRLKENRRLQDQQAIFGGLITLAYRDLLHTIPVASDDLGYIDGAFIENGRCVVQGWSCYVGTAAILLCIARDEFWTSNFEVYNRADVKGALGLDHDRIGFRFELPFESYAQARPVIVIIRERLGLHELVRLPETSDILKAAGTAPLDEHTATQSITEMV